MPFMCAGLQSGCFLICMCLLYVFGIAQGAMIYETVYSLIVESLASNETRICYFGLHNAIERFYKYFSMRRD